MVTGEILGSFCKRVISATILPNSLPRPHPKMGLSSPVATFARLLAAMFVGGAQANQSGAVDAVASAAIKGKNTRALSFAFVIGIS